MCMSNLLLNAVLNKNADALQSLFEGGAQLAVIEYKHKNASKMIDGSVWTQVILSNWKEGAEILTRNLPHMNNMDMVLLAVRSGSAEVVRVLWEHLEHSGTLEYTYETQEQILRSVMGGMGQVYNDAFQIKDMKETILTLVNLGVDLSGSLSGNFEFKDFRPEGHSIWTRAFAIRKLNYVEDFWPNWETMLSWPRLNETVFEMLNFTLKDEEVFNDPVFSLNARNILLKFLTIHGQQWLQQVVDEPPPNLFRSLNKDGGKLITHAHTLEGGLPHKTLYIDRGNDIITPTVLEFLCAPLQYKPSAWLRLPLILSQMERKKIWPLWHQLYILDPHQTWLDVLSGNPSKTNGEILKLLKNEAPDLWNACWYTTDQSGLSADQKWKLMGGEVFYE